MIYYMIPVKLYLKFTIVKKEGETKNKQANCSGQIKKFTPTGKSILDVIEFRSDGQDVTIPTYRVEATSGAPPPDPFQDDSLKSLDDGDEIFFNYDCFGINGISPMNKIMLVDLYLQQNLYPGFPDYAFIDNVQKLFGLVSVSSFRSDSKVSSFIEEFNATISEQDIGKYPGIKKLIEAKKMTNDVFSKKFITDLKKTNSPTIISFFDSKSLREMFIAHRYNASVSYENESPNRYKNLTTNKYTYKPNSYAQNDTFTFSIKEEGDNILKTLLHFEPGSTGYLNSSNFTTSIVDKEDIYPELLKFYEKGLPFGFSYDVTKKKYIFNPFNSDKPEMEIDKCPTLYSILHLTEEDYENFIGLNLSENKTSAVIAEQSQNLLTKIGAEKMKLVFNKSYSGAAGALSGQNFDLQKLQNDWSTVMSKDVVEESSYTSYNTLLLENMLVGEDFESGGQRGGGDKETLDYVREDIEKAVAILSDPVKRMGYNRMIEYVKGKNLNTANTISRKIANVLYLCNLNPVDIEIQIFDENGLPAQNFDEKGLPKKNVLILKGLTLTDSIIDVKRKIEKMDGYNDIQCYTLFLKNYMDAIDKIEKTPIPIIDPHGKIIFEPLDDACTLYECNLGIDPLSNKFGILKSAACKTIYYKTEDGELGRKMQINKNTTISNFLYLYGHFDTSLNMKAKHINFYSNAKDEDPVETIDLPEIQPTSMPIKYKESIGDLLSEIQGNVLYCEIIDNTLSASGHSSGGGSRKKKLRNKSRKTCKRK